MLEKCRRGARGESFGFLVYEATDILQLAEPYLLQRTMAAGEVLDAVRGAASEDADLFPTVNDFLMEVAPPRLWRYALLFVAPWVALALMAVPVPGWTHVAAVTGRFRRVGLPNPPSRKVIRAFRETAEGVIPARGPRPTRADRRRGWAHAHPLIW